MGQWLPFYCRALLAEHVPEVLIRIAEANQAGYVWRMKSITGRIVAVHTGSNKDLSKDEQSSITAELDGIVGCAHRGYSRKCWDDDKQARNSARRNERQWSAVSVEELAEVAADMGIDGPITAASVGANLCVEGVPELSRLPKGSLLTFPSGAELIVEEYNPPCKYMGEEQAKLHGVSATAFPKAAKLKRGIVGVVEAAGTINAGDSVDVTIYETPAWLVRSAD